MSANRCPNPSCEYFNRVLPTNANVCPMCGTGLGNAIASAPPPPPTPVSQPPVIQSPPKSSSAPDYTQYQSRVPAVPPPTPPLSPQVPALKLTHSSGKEFHLVGESGYIGRRSPSQMVAPEIDLTGLPGEDIISRQHARLAWDWSHNAYTIVDMSTNGVYLNGNLLTAGIPYRLINGDSLQIGQENLVNFKVVVS
jgi:pSer/pThr/pTyr-binding forkhead associated (FHA) protein